jgi:peptidoglycan/xylan/chitin deacetylase (PgdA/CDA1 family)
VRIRSLRITATAAAGAATALAAATTAAALVATRAIASPARANPVGLAGVRSATLVQNGRALEWTITLDHGLSRKGIASAARSECLLLETRRAHDLEETVCVSAPGRGSGLGLTRTSWHGTHAGSIHPLAGTVTPSGNAHTINARFSPTALGLPYRSLRWQVVSSASGARCPVATKAGAHGPTHRCTVLYPSARHPLARIHTPQLVGCVPAGPSLVYGGPSDKREIALTFDDGPWTDPPTIDFVNELKRLGVVGTFFEIGDQIGEFDPGGSVERAMLADGDMIGDHTWTHPDMLTLSAGEQTTELEQTNEAIRHATGFTPCLWRPPYGDTDSSLESLARNLGMLTIDWNIDPRDWALPGTSAIVATVLQEAQNGGITEMHFGGGPRYETLDALPQIVAALRSRGYRFVNLVQMLGLREVWH